MSDFCVSLFTFTRLCRVGLLSALLVFSALAHAKEMNILVLGDSLSAGFGINRTKGWVTLLENKLLSSAFCQTRTCGVVNASVSGSTTEDGANRITALLRRHKPSLLILELGGNDGLRGYPLTAMKRNLLTIIEQAQQHQASVFLLGIRIPPNYGKKYTEKFRQVFADVARSQPVDWVPFFLKGIATNAQLMQEDGIHPNEAAQPLMMTRVWQGIQPQLQTLTTLKAATP